jgi:hypothetical protein
MLYFLDEQRACLNDYGLTYGDARRIIQRDHKIRLLKWLETQIRSGVPLDQLRHQLTI